MKYKAYGKLNLGLNVIRKREDGYHELQMVMVPVDLFDTVELIESDTLRIESDKWYLPLNEKNTVYKAVMLMHEAYGTPTNFHIKLVKNIPTQAGMAGGSTDGACVINMINDKFNLNLSDQEKIDIGVKIGADVPFCLFNRPALVTGIGEKLEFLDIYTDYYIFLVKPNFGINTKELFNAFVVDKAQEEKFNDLVSALKNNDYKNIQKNLVNDLQRQVAKTHPQVQKIIQELIAFGFDNACMTGSGSVIFALTKDEALIKKAVVKFYNKFPLVKKSRIIDKSDTIIMED